VHDVYGTTAAFYPYRGKVRQHLTGGGRGGQWPDMLLAEKLSLAAAAAPLFRDKSAQDDRTRRRVHVTDRHGNIKALLTPLELRIAILERRFVELGVVIETREPGIALRLRPRALRCVCGTPYEVKSRGHIPDYCESCLADRYRCTTVVNGERCANRLNSATWTPCVVATRRGRPPMCGTCRIARVRERAAAKAAAAGPVAERVFWSRRWYQDRAPSRARAPLDPAPPRDSPKRRRALAKCKASLKRATACS